MTLKQAVRMELHLGLRKYKRSVRPKMDGEDFMMRKEFYLSGCVPFVVMVLFFDNRTEVEKRSDKPNKEHFSHSLCASSFSTSIPIFEIRNLDQEGDYIIFEKSCKEIFTIVHKFNTPKT